MPTPTKTVTKQCQRDGCKRRVTPPKRVCATCRKTTRRQQTRAHNLKRWYGLTDNEYAVLFGYNDGRCWICNGRRRYRLAVDHNHKTGEVRGLLCKSCNKLLAIARDSMETLDGALTYLYTSHLSVEDLLEREVKVPPTARNKKRAWQ